jgi:hypothetical protein
MRRKASLTTARTAPGARKRAVTVCAVLVVWLHSVCLHIYTYSAPADEEEEEESEEEEKPRAPAPRSKPKKQQASSSSSSRSSSSGLCTPALALLCVNAHV